MKASTMGRMQDHYDDRALVLAKWLRRAGELFDLHHNWTLVHAMVGVELADRNFDFGRELAAIAVAKLAQREHEYSDEIEQASHASWTDVVPPDCLCHWRYQTKPDVWRQIKRNPLCVHHGGKDEAE